MTHCELIDYSERPASTIELYEYPAVTRSDIQELKETVPFAPLGQVKEGDFLVVHIIDNRSEGIRGLLTAWYNKSLAWLDTGNGGIWGEWEPDLELLVTAEIVAAFDPQGTTVRGRMAYNSHGIRGIFSDGRFYTLHEPAYDVEAGSGPTGDEWTAVEPHFLCHDTETHAAHICQLRKKGAVIAAKHHAEDPAVSCLLCEALADSPDHVCSPVRLG